MSRSVATRTEAAARAFIHDRSRRGDVARRQPPDLVVDSGGSSTTVYYLAPHTNSPSGGVKMLYKHVDLLNEMGVEAAVLHALPGFRCTWFDNRTRVVYARDIRLTPYDILVVPDYYGPGFHRLPQGVRTLVFNQGAHYTFSLTPYEGTEPGAPYSSLSDLVGIMTVSADSERLLRFAFPDTAITRCRPIVDGAVFRPPVAPPQPALAYVPSRRQEELQELQHLLRARGITWPQRPIVGRTEREVSDILRTSALFLSLSDRDGFGLPPAEAMASGCYVVGYHGGGGEEFFDPSYSHPVNGLAEFAEAVLEATRLSIDELAARGARASAAVLSRYNEAGLRADLRETFAGLIPL